MKDIDIDAELAAFEAAEKARLGLDEEREQWTDEMVDPNFTAAERPHVTLLVGGLTMAHDYLVEGALTGIGYRVRALDCPDHQALRMGKEYGNRAQCNPTYFTVGNLVKELCRLRDEEGLSSQEIIDNYVFLTAGACGPCRFGMYVTEYRKALRDAGFDGFRVMLFQQTGGLKQASGEELGLVLGPTFFFAIAKALFSGDVINTIGYRIRPYELEEGATDRALGEVKKGVYDALVNRTSVIAALVRGRKILSRVAVDKTAPKPKVNVLGEFWAMTTEGDGNYHLQRFLEQEGAEVTITPLVNTLLYNVWEFRHDTLARAELKGADGGKFGLADTDVGLTMAGLWLGELALRGTFYTFAAALGLKGYHLPDMDEVAKHGHHHYNVELRGGEGHMEVAKLILNVVKNKSHMTISVKPFGCMPSSGVSDGVQSVVTELYPDAIFCPVETSGDGAVNFYSRVQMYLFKARQRALEEHEAALKEHGVTREQVRERARGSGRADALFNPPHRAAGTGADMIHDLGPLVGKGALGRARVRVARAAAGARELAMQTAPSLARRYGQLVPYLPSLARFAAKEAAQQVPSPRALYNSLLDRAVRPDESTVPDAVVEPATPATGGTRLPIADAAE